MIIYSFGYRCNSISILKRMNLRNEAYPFDWTVSDLKTIQDCIETNFEHFLNPNNYIKKRCSVGYSINNIEKFIIAGRGPEKGKRQTEPININKYYNPNINDINFHNCKLGMLHHDIVNDIDYFKRCINRLKLSFKSDEKKFYLYIHRVLDTEKFFNTYKEIYKSFDNFSKFISSKTNNIFGLYFILIQGVNNLPFIYSPPFQDNNSYNVHIIYCSDNFFDAGVPFVNGNDTQQKIVEIVNKFIK